VSSARHTQTGDYSVRGSGRLTPKAVREVRFRRSHGLSRGLRAEDVRQFVDQVSDDMASLYDELAAVYAENHRIKTALRDWQSTQAVPPSALRDQATR
jgi:DivIVA domain-containing protein